MIEILLLAGGIVAVILISMRLGGLERRLLALELRAAPGFAPPAPPSPAPPPPPAAEDMPPAVPEPSAEAAVPPPASATPPRAGLPPAIPLPAEGAAPMIAPPPLPARGLEETLGARWAVWVGGLALALGGIFLVRYSIEQGLIGPRLRVLFGSVFALVLVAAGEWLRRREANSASPRFASANIPAILTAAGTSTAFATTYAAYGLYGFLGPAAAFAALGAISLVTMAAALLHGPALAALGLVAALAAPLLVSSRDPSPEVLVAYLTFVVGAAYGVARLRLWRWLAITAAAGAWLWGVLLVFGGHSWISGAVAHLLVQLTLASIFLVFDPYRGDADGTARVDAMAAIVLFAFALLAVALGAESAVGPFRSIFATLVVLVLCATAWRHGAASPALAAGTLVSTGILALWPVASEVAREPQTLVRDLAGAPRPDALVAYLWTAAFVNALVFAAGVSRLALGRSLRLPVAAWYAGAATLGPLAGLVVTYWRVTAFDRSIPFALVAAALAVLFATSAAALKRRDDRESPALTLGVGATASAAVAALAAGLTFALDRGPLTVALALSALGTALIAERAAVPALRFVVAGLGIAVAGRLVWDPSVMGGAVGTMPVVNWLLWGYGVPALAFGLASHVLSRAGRDGVTRFLEGLSFLFAALLVFLEIRHALNGGDPFRPTSGHLEAGLVVTEMLGFALLAVRLDLFRPDSFYRWASIVFGGLAIAGSLWALGLRFDPALTDEPILGGRLLNSLLPAYLIPAATACVLAVSSRRARPLAFVLAAAFGALALELAYAMLEVRVLFGGDRIGWWRPTPQGELWSYSLVLIANGIALVAAGFVWNVRLVRVTGLGCLGLAILKVFVFDLSALDGLTRALSFVGLGLALVAIGFAYQRLLAWRNETPAAAPG